MFTSDAILSASGVSYDDVNKVERAFIRPSDQVVSASIHRTSHAWKVEETCLFGSCLVRISMTVIG